MWWIIITVLAIIAVFITSQIRINGKMSPFPYAIGIAWAIVTMLFSVNQIGAGNVGIVYQFGDIVGKVNPGLQIIAPWKSIYEANTQVDSHVIQKADMFSKENQDVFAKITVNLEVSPDHVMDLYRRVGPKYYEKIVLPSITTFVKEETVKYLTTDVAANREQLRHIVSRRLTEELAPYSVIVKNVFFDNIDFNPKFKEAIEEKQRQTQLALAEEQKIAGERHKANQLRERTEGEADSRLILAKKEGDSKLYLAQKEAEANLVLAQSITPTLVNYLSVQKLAPNVSVMMVPPNQNMLMQMDGAKK